MNDSAKGEFYSDLSSCCSSFDKFASEAGLNLHEILRRYEVLKSALITMVIGIEIVSVKSIYDAMMLNGHLDTLGLVVCLAGICLVMMTNKIACTFSGLARLGMWRGCVVEKSSPWFYRSVEALDQNTLLADLDFHKAVSNSKNARFRLPIFIKGMILVCEERRDKEATVQG